MEIAIISSRSSLMKRRHDTQKNKKGNEGLSEAAGYYIMLTLLGKETGKRTAGLKMSCVLKWKVMESQAGARAKRWKEDVSEEVTLDLVDLY